MIENTERPRPRPQKDLQTKSKTPTKSIFLTGLQLVICALAIVAVFVIKQFGGDFYTQIRPTVKDALSQDITQGDVTQVFKDLGKQLPDAAEIFKNDSAVSSSASQASSAQSSSSSQAASSSSAASGEQTQSQAPATSSATVSATNVKNLAFEKPKINTTLCSTESQQPPETATTAPYILSVKPLKPVDGGRLTSAYGYRVNPVTGKYTFHTGMDIAAPEGTPIKATLAGVVEEVASNDDYGNYCLIDHGNGVKSFYAECAEITAKKGDKIAAGGLVGTVGTTGITTGPHLHFEIRINSKNHNPQWVV